MAAMILRRPPQRSHSSTSISNTRIINWPSHNSASNLGSAARQTHPTTDRQSTTVESGMKVFPAQPVWE